MRVAWPMVGAVPVGIPQIVAFLPTRERFVRSIGATGPKG